MGFVFISRLSFWHYLVFVRTADKNFFLDACEIFYYQLNPVKTAEIWRYHAITRESTKRTTRAGLCF